MMDPSPVLAQSEPCGPSQQERRQQLIKLFIEMGKEAFNPDARGGSQAEARQRFDTLVERTKTINLIAMLNHLIRLGAIPPWLTAKFKQVLARAPLRPGGVRDTLEFIFAIHPSSAVRYCEVTTPQKRGANITLEALRLTTRVIATPPSFVKAETWFSGVSGQLLHLLEGRDGPELSRAAAYILGFGVLGNKQVGAPGSPGWNHIAEPLLDCIHPSSGEKANPFTDSPDAVIDLSKPRTLVEADDLARALHLLRSLLLSHPNPGLCKRLLRPIVLSLWALASWTQDFPVVNEKYISPAKELLNIFLRLAMSTELMLGLIQNIGYLGGRDPNQPEWLFVQSEDKSIEVISSRHLDLHIPRRLLFKQMERKSKALLDLIDLFCSDSDICELFLHLFKKWLSSNRKDNAINLTVTQEDEEVDSYEQLIEAKILQGMMEIFPPKLANQPNHVLELAGQVLSHSQRADADDENTAVALSLVKIMITTPGFQKSRVKAGILQLVEASLVRLSSSDDSDTARTAQSLSLVLHYHDGIEEPLRGMRPPDLQIEDRKTYSLAISYITQPDSPPPVKTEGLSLISSLAASNSPVLDIPATLVLMSRLLAEEEDYINFKVIKIYTMLADRHPKSVATELLDQYVDARESATVDTRLRFGEALIQVVERLGQTFAGNVAQRVGEALLATAGRRGRRPHTERRQEKEERLGRIKMREAEQAWGGEVPDMSVEDDEATTEEKARNEILARIVEGWVSKRGSEDVRIRASALSLLSHAIETNVAGLGGRLVLAAVDLSIDVLRLEREMEQGILRRAAVLLIQSFLRALDLARQKGQRLGFGLAAQDVLTIVRYVAETDNDGLVCQHARDVIESLENWQASLFVSEQRAGVDFIGGGLTTLAGLSVNPGHDVFLGNNCRPRIQEIA